MSAERLNSPACAAFRAGAVEYWIMKASTSLAIVIVVESALCSIVIKVYKSAAIMIADTNVGI
jgi:hypothetical protein